MRSSWSVLTVLSVACLFSPVQAKAASESPVPTDVQQSDYVPVHRFDPKRDAEADIDAAIIEARRTAKRVIVDIGGDWCQYCHQMDQLFRDHPDILEIRDKNFITVDVYYGPDNKNARVLSHYSKVLGIPHFFVLEKDGTLLHSQHMRELRSGGTYSADKMKEFLTKWSVSNHEKSATD